jgi:hypothetical protein
MYVQRDREKKSAALYMPTTNLVLSGKKREHFYLAYNQNFCPKDLIRFYSFPLGGQTTLRALFRDWQFNV